MMNKDELLRKFDAIMAVAMTGEKITSIEGTILRAWILESPGYLGLTSSDEGMINIPVKIPSLAEWAGTVEDRFGEIGNEILKSEARINMLMKVVCKLHDIDLETLEKESLEKEPQSSAKCEGAPE